MSKLNLQVQLLPTSSYLEWNEFVLSNQHATLFHSTDWLANFGELSVVVVLADSKIVGGCALVKTRKKGIKGYHVPPITPYFGPIVDHKITDQTQRQRIVQQILKALPKSATYDFILLPEYQDLLPYIWAGYSPTVRYTYRTNLALNDWQSAINKNKARDYRKAQKHLQEGKVKLSKNAHNLDAVLALVEETAARKNFALLTALYKRVFENGNLKSIWNTKVVETPEGQPLAAVLTVSDRFQTYYLFNGRVKELPKEFQNINLLIMGQAIEEAIENKRIFDFEGSMLQGVEQYFRLLAGVQQPIFRLQKSNSLMHHIMRFLKQRKHERSNS